MTPHVDDADWFLGPSLSATPCAIVLVGRLDLDNPAAVTRAPPFVGSFPVMGPPVLESEGVDAWFNAAFESARNVMAGVFGCA